VRGFDQEESSRAEPRRAGGTGPPRGRSGDLQSDLCGRTEREREGERELSLELFLGTRAPVIRDNKPRIEIVLCTPRGSLPPSLAISIPTSRVSVACRDKRTDRRTIPVAVIARSILREPPFLSRHRGAIGPNSAGIDTSSVVSCRPNYRGRDGSAG